MTLQPPVTPRAHLRGPCGTTVTPSGHIPPPAATVSPSPGTGKQSLFNTLPTSRPASRDDERRRALRAADAALNRLRLYLRLAHHWTWLSDGQYAHVSAMVAEIGKLLGGWIRQHQDG